VTPVTYLPRIRVPQRQLRIIELFQIGVLMDPILLIHGYSAESSGTSASDIESIYGSLPRALRQIYGAKNVLELDVSRYLSLNDGVTIDDISRAMHHCLREDFPHLLQKRFHVIVHSTGALVIRNWIRLFSKRPSPVQTIIYLAGANFGSGWAHIGRGQLAKWGRQVFQHGADRGLKVLDALELGSSSAIELHLHFTRRGHMMSKEFETNECVITGSQADVSWFPIPVRYAKEDGSDGVVRVSAANLNFNYVRFGPSAAAHDFTWKQATTELRKHLARRGGRDEFYEIKESSRPGSAGRPIIPLAIPYGCAHSGKEMGVVDGEGRSSQVLELIRMALSARPPQWENLVNEFEAITNATYARVLKDQKPAWFTKWIQEPRTQYDKHAQIIFRIRDQNQHPVLNYDVFFDSVQGRRDPSAPIGKLFEDSHRNDVSPHTIAFYVRTDRFDKERQEWVAQVPAVDGCYLEVSAIEPATQEVIYLPMRVEFTKQELIGWLQPHRTTIIDVELLRLPSPEVFRIAVV